MSLRQGKALESLTTRQGCSAIGTWLGGAECINVTGKPFHTRREYRCGKAQRAMENHIVQSTSVCLLEKGPKSTCLQRNLITKIRVLAGFSHASLVSKLSMAEHPLGKCVLQLLTLDLKTCSFGCARTSEWPERRNFRTNMWSHFHPLRVQLKAA